MAKIIDKNNDKVWIFLVDVTYTIIASMVLSYLSYNYHIVVTTNNYNVLDNIIKVNACIVIRNELT